jgi:hypothetical protein
MAKIVSLGLIIGGIVLITYGVTASDSVSSDFSRFFTGSPTDRTMWLLIGGSVVALVGAAGLFGSSKSI